MTDFWSIFRKDSYLAHGFLSVFHRAQGLISDNADPASSDVHDSLPDEDSAVAQSLCVDGNPVFAEVETEPEADINNKDLAEADQSLQPPSSNHHPDVAQARSDADEEAVADQMANNMATDVAEDDLGATASAALLVREDVNALQNPSSTEHHSVSVKCICSSKVGVRNHGGIMCNVVKVNFFC